MKYVVGALLFGAFLWTGCSDVKQWSNNQQSQWMTVCGKSVEAKIEDPDTRRSFCGCVLGKVQDVYPTVQASLEMPEDEQRKFYQDCEAELGIR